MKQLKKPFYIVIEGIDGSGKSTLAKNLHNYFLSQNFPSILTKEPSENLIGQQIRTILQNKIKIEQKAQYLLFAADRAQHFQELIIPALKETKIVISDRGSDSSLAYQGYGRGLDISMINKINQWVTNDINPDLIIYLKIDPKLALERVTKRNEEISEFENLALLEKIANGFDIIFKDKKNVIELNALDSQDNLLKQIIPKLKSFI